VARPVAEPQGVQHSPRHALGGRLSTLRQRLGSRRAALWALVLSALLLGGCNLPAFWASRGHDVQGHDTFKLWSAFVILALIVGGTVYGLIFWSIIRYRRKSNEIPKQFQQHLGLEAIYTIVPIIIVLVMFYFTVVTENEVDYVSRDPATTVKVTAFQWGWLYHYQGTDVTVGSNDEFYPQLVLPTGTTHVILVSNDVVHGFYARDLDFSRYALPGVVNQFDLTFKSPQLLRGECTQFCGLYHSYMIFSIKVLKPDQFKAWLQREEFLQRNQPPVPIKEYHHVVPPAAKLHLPPTKTPALNVTSVGDFKATGSAAGKVKVTPISSKRIPVGQS
jgi:cytochrome c oxidase subunit 2